MTTAISNSDNVLDSRDVIAWIKELEDGRGDLVSNVDEAKEAYIQTDTEADDYDAVEEKFTEAETALSDWDDDYGDELKALKALADEAEGYASDWKYGSPLIRDDYFTEYAEELCKDIGDLPQNIPSYIEIDWDKTADNIKADYTAVEFDGVTYWIR